MRTILIALSLLIGLCGSADARYRHRHHRDSRHRTVCLPPATDDRDLIVRTVMGEARNEPFEGMVAVAAVIINRTKETLYGGPTVRNVVSKHKAFEPWLRHCTKLKRFNQRSPGWIEATLATNAALSGDDPTGGGTHFANIPTVEGRHNHRALSWIRRLVDVRQIGKHTFGREPTREAHLRPTKDARP